MDRRSLIIGGACLIAAPAIVRIGSLMPVKVIGPKSLDELVEETIRKRSQQIAEAIEHDIYSVPPSLTLYEMDVFNGATKHIRTWT